MGNPIPIKGKAGSSSRQAERLAIIDEWANAWADASLTTLHAYETGIMIGEAAVALIRQDYRASEWMLSELLEILPRTELQRSLRSGILDAVTRALGVPPLQ